MDPGWEFSERFTENETLKICNFNTSTQYSEQISPWRFIMNECFYFICT